MKNAKGVNTTEGHYMNSIIMNNTWPCDRPMTCSGCAPPLALLQLVLNELV